MIQAIIIRGDFDHEDYRDLVALIRQIDDRHPERTYEICAVDPTASAIESAQAVMDALPPQPGRSTSPIAIHRKKEQA